MAKKDLVDMPLYVSIPMIVAIFGLAGAAVISGSIENRAKKVYEQTYKNVIMQHADMNMDGIVSQGEKSDFNIGFSGYLSKVWGVKHVASGNFVGGDGKEVSKRTLTELLKDYESELSR